MALSNVNMRFAPGNQLQGATTRNVDNTFVVIAPATVALPNTLTPLTALSSVTTDAGYGYGPELCGQVLANGAGTVYLIAANKTVVDDDTYDYGIGAVTQSRVDAPTLTATSLNGLPDTPLQPSYSNTGKGNVYFNTNSTLQPSADAATISVQVTTPGALGTAVATIEIGAVSFAGVSLTSSPWTQPYAALATSSGSYGSGTVANDSPVSGESTFTLGSGTPWTVDQYAGYIFVDHTGASFTILSNTNHILTVSGLPATGTNSTSSIHASAAGHAIILDFILGLGDTFASGDFFESLPTPNDDYVTRVMITSINAQGQDRKSVV